MDGCLSSNMQCTSRVRLMAHERCRAEEQPYNCSYCQKTFAHHSTRVAHERSHRRAAALSHERTLVEPGEITKQAHTTRGYKHQGVSHGSGNVTPSTNLKDYFRSKKNSHGDGVINESGIQQSAQVRATKLRQAVVRHAKQMKYDGQSVHVPHIQRNSSDHVNTQVSRIQNASGRLSQIQQTVAVHNSYSETTDVMKTSEISDHVSVTAERCHTNNSMSATQTQKYSRTCSEVPAKVSELKRFRQLDYTTSNKKPCLRPNISKDSELDYVNTRNQIVRGPRGLWPVSETTLPFKPFSCPECSHKFFTKCGLARHECVKVVSAFSHRSGAIAAYRQWKMSRKLLTTQVLTETRQMARAQNSTRRTEDRFKVQNSSRGKENRLPNIPQSRPPRMAHRQSIHLPSIECIRASNPRRVSIDTRENEFKVQTSARGNESRLPNVSQSHHLRMIQSDKSQTNKKCTLCQKGCGGTPKPSSTKRYSLPVFRKQCSVMSSASGVID